VHRLMDQRMCGGGNEFLKQKWITAITKKTAHELS
jgi:hypothetical protein